MPMLNLKIEHSCGRNLSSEIASKWNFFPWKEDGSKLFGRNCLRDRKAVSEKVSGFLTNARARQIKQA